MELRRIEASSAFHIEPEPKYPVGPSAKAIWSDIIVQNHHRYQSSARMDMNFTDRHCTCINLSIGSAAVPRGYRDRFLSAAARVCEQTAGKTWKDKIHPRRIDAVVSQRNSGARDCSRDGGSSHSVLQDRAV